MRILVATMNEGKLREYQRLLVDVTGLELETMASLSERVEVEEDRDTFAGNAQKKAIEIAAASGLTCLADDSGLEVDALGGRPGVYSARYAGEGASDEKNNQKLLDELRGVPDQLRTARFRCVICVAESDGREVALVDGACEGHIGHEPKGEHGFGYDPLFIPEGFMQTMAELGPDTKNQISHRAKAAAKLATLLRELPTP